MADLPESATYPAGIYQLEQTDPVVGGPPNLATGEGMSNVQAQQLADRTRWLKTELESRTAPAAILAGLKTVDGAGSGLDADLLDGYAPSTSADANTIARRDFQRDIHARLLRSDYANQSTIPLGAAIAMRIDATTDNYVRLVTAPGFVAWLSANNGGLDADTVDNLHASSFMRTDQSTETSGNITAKGGSVYVQPATNTANSHFWLKDETGKNQGIVYWSRGEDELRIARYAADGSTFEGRIDIKPGGIVAINGSTVWHAGNDGSGSGLDADFLDGFGSSQFMRSDAANTVSGNLTIDNTGPMVKLDESDTATAGRMTISGGEMYFQMGAAGAGATTSSGKMYFTGYNGADLAAFEVRFGGAYRKIWHEGNDGSGSGLDADLLDGQHLSYFQQDLEQRGNIELGRGLSGDRSTYIDLHSSGTPGAVDYHTRLIRYSGADGTLALVQTGNGVIQLSGGSDLQRNGATIWHGGNDGAGSGLDADKLDGLQASQFLRSDTSDGMTGSMTAYAFLADHDPGNAVGNSFRTGLTYREGGIAQGRPQDYFTSLSVKQGGHRHFEIGANKNSDDLQWRSINDPSLLSGWGEWRKIWHSGDAAASLASAGYQRLPSGLILQWRAGANGHNSLLTFPIAFPNACFGVAFGDVNGPDTTANADVLSYANLTKTGFTFRPYNNNGAPSSGGTDYFFIALGY